MPIRHRTFSQTPEQRLNTRLTDAERRLDMQARAQAVGTQRATATDAVEYSTASLTPVVSGSIALTVEVPTVLSVIIISLSFDMKGVGGAAHVLGGVNVNSTTLLGLDATTFTTQAQSYVNFRPRYSTYNTATEQANTVAIEQPYMVTGEDLGFTGQVTFRFMLQALTGTAYMKNRLLSVIVV